MASIKFPLQQIEKFNDRIENCLQDLSCRNIFEIYLTQSKKYNALNTLKLWTTANSGTSFSEDMYDLIDDVDGFNENPLLSISEHHQKLDYVKSECSRILNKHGTHKKFIQYLLENHRL
ncbi:hypothetical protein BDFB_000102 [Asbolus verrucosus]|uniref:Uncharacterized protein n=1 Tax=Asbolus verrucosus TaxID=1661398 RepID=A0A482VGD5_ASBVE|nr:hypothetical protein BDFB_000102 [Asbolus verrucosus]